MRIDIPIDPSGIPTAQEKGVRVVKGIPMFYKKKPLQDFEKSLESLLAPHYPKLRIPDGEPCYLHITYLYPFPSSMPKRDRIDYTRKTTRPDGDNISKALIDALGDRWAKDKRTRKFYVVRRGFFADDAQVNPLVISRFYTNDPPKIVVEVNAVCKTLRKPQPNP